MRGNEQGDKGDSRRLKRRETKTQGKERYSGAVIELEM
jgi:hypothetical protein